MFVTTVMTLVALYTAASIAYVYRFRGTARYDSFRQYARKSWPLFAPLNCLLYLLTSTRGRGAILDPSRFAELAEIRDNWPTIRAEADALYQRGYFARTVDAETDAYYDIGFRTFYKYGWSKFYIKWYGHIPASAQALCPATTRLLARIPSVRGGMFTLLPPRSQLTRHSDPIAVSLRYHLGLRTPNSAHCFINVDGRALPWFDGEVLMFDETYPHFVENNTDHNRLILMCDIARPTYGVGSVLRWAYEGLARLTVVPNLVGDKKGFANRVFAHLAPVLARSKALKATNRSLYRVLKWSVNVGLMLGALAALTAVLRLVS